MAGGQIYPTADQVARALVTAATWYGELDYLRHAPRRILAGSVWPELKSSWAVLAALDVAYVNMGLHQLARLVGLVDHKAPPSRAGSLRFVQLGEVAIAGRVFTTELIAKKREPWWSTDLEAELFKVVAL